MMKESNFLFIRQVMKRIGGNNKIIALPQEGFCETLGEIALI